MRIKDLTTPIPDLDFDESVNYSDQFIFNNGFMIDIDIKGSKLVGDMEESTGYYHSTCSLYVDSYSLYDETGEELNVDLVDFIEEFEEELNEINS